MSDSRRIADARKQERENATPEMRLMLAVEHSADALEGIRQDLTLLNVEIGRLIQAIGNRPKT